MARTERGFSLPELLIVVAVIGIIAAIAVPGFLQAQQASRESAAIQSLRTLTSAQNTYINTAGGYQMYASAGQLTSAGLVDSFLLSAPRNGYLITVTMGSPASTYTANADPVNPTATTRHFFTSNDGNIHYHVGDVATASDPNIPQ